MKFSHISKRKLFKLPFPFSHGGKKPPGGRKMNGGTEKEKLSNDEIKQLIQRAINDGIDEAKYYLRLSEWSRPGSSFEDHGEIKLIYGEIDKILIDHVYDYPTTNEYQYFIVPKTKAVVIIHKYGNDYDGKYVEHEDLYVFTAKDGWKRIPLS